MRPVEPDSVSTDVGNYLYFTLKLDLARVVFYPDPVSVANISNGDVLVKSVLLRLFDRWSDHDNQYRFTSFSY